MSDIYHYTGLIIFWAASSLFMAFASTWLKANHILILPRALVARMAWGRLRGMNISLVLPHVLRLSLAWEVDVPGFRWRSSATRRRQSQVLMLALSSHPSLIKQKNP